MSQVSRIVFFMFMVNVAAAIMISLGGDVWIETGGISTDGGQQAYVENLKGNVTGYPVDQQGSSVFIRIFDYITLGYLGKIIAFVDNGLYGFVNMLVSTGFIAMGGCSLVPPDPNTCMSFMYYGLKTILSLVYIIWAIELYIGRNILGD